MILESLALFGLVLAAIPAGMVLLNLTVYRVPPTSSSRPRVTRPEISVLIPARDEESTIGRSVEAALISRGVDVEVVVMDDHSRDRTAEIVRALAERDSRVRLVQAPPLPAGWNGKQHACYALSREARFPLLAFVDADVRLSPDGLRRALCFLDARDADLVSGIPRQETGSPMEKLIIPLIHFVLLGFLPMLGVRWSRHPAFAAGCGQFLLARRDAYREVGGHGVIRGSRHDGIALPRAFRRAGRVTDLFDATPVAVCRMYQDGREVWQGFAKNATEGMAAPGAIGIWTTLLLGGQVLPFVLLPAALVAGSSTALAAAGLAAILAAATRLALTLRFWQSWRGALLHPVGIAVVVAIQWYAWWQARRGLQISWKGRTAPGRVAPGREPLEA